MTTTEINGLEWHPTYSTELERGCSVASFPTNHLVHLVFHGEQPFRHTHYGIHLGFSDRLTFLGPCSRILRGYFIDCRKDSPTLHKRVVLSFSPSAKQTLSIPCGVAHAFDGMEGIDTINNFEASLPDPSLLLTDKSPWATGADIQYFALDANDAEIPTVQQNVYPASETFYDLLSEMQKVTLAMVEHEYPHTEEVEFPDGTSTRVMVRRPVSQQQQIRRYEPISDIQGLGWKGHLVVWSGSNAGYSALVDPSPIEVIKHGALSSLTEDYSVDLGFENHLTFVGPAGHACKAKFIDCRASSPSCHREAHIEFSPSPLRFLCVPVGVAYAFENLENVFIINRPRKCAGDFSWPNEYAGVIQWPIDRRPAPKFHIHETDAPLEYYKQMARMIQGHTDRASRLLPTISAKATNSTATFQASVGP
jgi:dTDP-4-dehydrorhamnose 3,5-epimerase-like enzyme